MADCGCLNNWRVYATDLWTGQVRAILHPISMEWENRLNDFGTGTLQLATQDLRIRDVWPHLTGIYIARIAGDGASPAHPVAEWGGMVEKVTPGIGATAVGMVSIDGYLNSRDIKSTLRFDQVNQNEIGVALVDYARQNNGIPLFGFADASSWQRDRTYWNYNRKNIGEAVLDLSQVIEGPDWELRHTLENGHWSTTMVFRDRVGLERDLIIRSDREASDYSLTVDAMDQATWIDAIGSGEEEDMLIRTARDGSGIYPQFDATPAWKDVTREQTLLEHAQGYLAEHQEPVTTPQVTLPGLDVSPLLTRLGDVIGVEIDYGAISYSDSARITGISWGIDADNPEFRTLEMIPLGRASETVLNQEPTDDCREGC